MLAIPLSSASPFLFPGANLPERRLILLLHPGLRLGSHLPTDVVLEPQSHFGSPVYKRNSDIAIHTVRPKGRDCCSPRVAPLRVSHSSATRPFQRPASSLGALALAVVYETFSRASTKYSSASFGEQKTSPLHAFTRQAFTDVSKPTELFLRTQQSVVPGWWKTVGIKSRPRDDACDDAPQTQHQPQRDGCFVSPHVFLHFAHAVL